MGTRPWDAKRLFDVVVACAALVVAAPVIAVSAALVRVVAGPGPVFERVPSLGLDRRPIQVLKLRTRAIAASPAVRAEDPFTTALRAVRFDELPQLWNVVRGDLSLVGPRPLPEAFLDLDDALQQRILTARPGITGLAQLDARFEDAAAGVGPTPALDDPVAASRRRLDCYYLDHRSMWLDLRILARTPLWLVKRMMAFAHGKPSLGLADRTTRSRTGALLDRIGRLRGRHLFVLDTAAVALALYLAFVLRFTFADAPSLLEQYRVLVVLILVVRPGTGVFAGLYSRLWRYAGARDYVRVGVGVGVGTVVCVVVYYGVLVPLGLTPAEPPVPRSIWVLEALLTLVLVLGTRFVVRYAAHANRPSIAAPPRLRTLLYGAGSAGTMMASSALSEPMAGLEPVGFLDDDPTRKRQLVAGLPVFGGIDALSDAVTLTGAQLLLITMPAAPGTVIRRVTEAGWAADLEVRTVPPLHELLDGSIDAFRVRRVRVEDLIRRPQVTELADQAEGIVRGRCVLVTGAGGSIGSELARQVLAMRPRRLVIVDRAESALYTIQRELETRQSPHETEVSTYLANVVSRAAMDRIVGSTRPDVIFHAAACKHVPMMETHTSEALQVNVGGTLAVVEAAVAADTSTFVLVSTDKAVDPTSTMGATKRLAEWIVADAARRTGRAYVSVRFGNVLGSNGSVIPIFQEQLEAGLPLTITDREMTRYFMTIPEASSLIIAASSLGSAGDLFVLDMGEPIRILDLARDFVRLAGRDPETVPIVFTGTRPGEKLHETLFYDHESTRATAHPKVLLARGSMPPEDIRAAIEGLLRLADGEHDEVARRELFAMIHGRMEVLAKPAPHAKVGPAVAPRTLPDAPAAAAASNA